MDDSLHQAVALLIAPGQIVEVRVLTDQWIHSGYFDDREELARQVAALDTEGEPVASEALRSGKVSSVAYASTGLQLELGLAGTYSLFDIRKIM